MQLVVRDRAIFGVFIALFCFSPAIAKEYLPSHINVIELPFEYVGRIQMVRRSEHHLIVVGGSTGPICHGSSGYCPTMHIYERDNGTWELRQSFEFAESGGLQVIVIAPDRFATIRRMSFSGGRSDYELLEYRLNALTNDWEQSSPIGRYNTRGMAYHNGVYLTFVENTILFTEENNGTWTEIDRIYLNSVLDVGEGHYVVQVLVRDDTAFILFCASHNCSLANPAVVMLNMATRTFSSVFEVDGFAGLSRFALFGEQMVFGGVRVPPTADVKPPVVYEQIGGTWQFAGEAILHFDWLNADDLGPHTDDTLFENRDPRFDFKTSNALVFYQRNQSNQWEQMGQIIIANGEILMHSLAAAAAHGTTVYFAEGHAPTHTRIFELPNYLDYLDLDKDVLPRWWEEQYGFSPDVFDDFSLDGDEDGLTDFEEFKFQTSPILSDSDADRMPDGWEINHLLDPRDPSDATSDADADHVSNVQEFLNGTDPLNGNDNPRDSNQPPLRNSGGGATSWLILALLLHVALYRRR